MFTCLRGIHVLGPNVYGYFQWAPPLYIAVLVSETRRRMGTDAKRRQRQCSMKFASRVEDACHQFGALRRRSMRSQPKIQ